MTSLNVVYDSVDNFSHHIYGMPLRNPLLSHAFAASRMDILLHVPMSSYFQDVQMSEHHVSATILT